MDSYILIAGTRYGMGAHTGEEGDNYAIRGTIENTSSGRTVDYHLLLNGSEVSSGSVEFGKSANIISANGTLHEDLYYIVRIG